MWKFSERKQKAHINVESNLKKAKITSLKEMRRFPFKLRFCDLLTKQQVEILVCALLAQNRTKVRKEWSLQCQTKKSNNP